MADSSTTNDYIATDLGNVAPNPRGEYDGSAEYEYLDLVYHNGGSYLCCAELDAGDTITGIAPEDSTNTDYWQCLTIPGTATDEYTEMYAAVIAANTAAAESATAAAESATAAATSETNAAASASEATKAATASGENKDTAAGYAYQAAASATAAAESATVARTSAENAATSESNASTSADKAATSAESAAASATSAAKSAESISVDEEALAESVAAAAASAAAAATSESNASASADAAAESAKEAAASATAANTSATNAASSATAAAGSATEASTSAEEAAASATSATDSASAAEASEDAASGSADTASGQAIAAAASAAAAAASAEAAAESAAEAEKLAETYAVSTMLDGTADTYKSVMRKWFLMMGAQELVDAEDYAGLTGLVDEWYEITRDSWCGYTEFYQPDVSAVSYGTKGGDNADLTCTPSTDTVENQDDYAGLPLFACTDCNWVIDEDTLQPVVTAIDGITDNFSRYNPDKYVGVLQMAGYLFFEEGEETYKIGYAATRANPYASIQPVAESVNPDGSVRSWVVHSKYMSHTTDDGKMSSYSGVIPTAWVSHNTVHTLSAVNGTGYSGGCITDDAWLFLMATIKYGSLTLDGILQGYVTNAAQYYAQVAEEGVNRIIISADSKYLFVGAGVLLGNYASSTDRGSLYSITGQKGAIITKIETVTIDGTDYMAVYVDTDDVFDTSANSAATEGTTYISTFHWANGSCDTVLGNDGSPTSCTNGWYPAKLQGIEYSVGAYEVYADVILNLYLGDDETTYYYEPYIVRLRANQSTAITSNYEAIGLTVEQPASSSWQYIKKRSYANGVFFATEVGGTSSTYLRDGFYMNAATVATREWLAFGYLNYSVAVGGLSCLYGHLGLPSGNWYSSARLSPNGNRGEWAA